MRVKDIRLVGDNEVLILWQNDSRSLLSAPYLQLSCRCAHCVDEWTGEVLVSQADIDDQVKIRSIDSVGNYGVKFAFSAGCRNGIYSFEYLDALSQAQRQRKEATKS